jgi:CheY-like chemotaxis protein
VESAADGAAGIAVAVSDTGEGIPPQLLPQVFELFTQGERASRGSQAGLGIGLALSRQLIELHGGRIEARSDGAGRGTTVTFTLPLVQPSPATVEPSIQSERGRLVQRRVLIVDDNHDAADAMGMLIEQFGGEARVAYDGESGVREAATYQPDVVFLDLGMPGLDGYDTCRHIRSQAGAAAFIVALTGWGQEHDKQRAADAGFDAHLTKPADPKAIEQLLGQQSLRS